MHKFCYCCGETSEFNIIKKTGKSHKYCKRCEANYNAKERRENQFKTVINLLKNVDMSE